MILTRLCWYGETIRGAQRTNVHQQISCVR